MEKELLIAKNFDMKIVENIKEYPFVKQKVSIIPYLFAKENSLLALDEKNDKVIVAISDPLNLEAINELRLMLNKEIEVLFCSKEILEKAIERCYHHGEEEKVLLFSSNAKETDNKDDNFEGYDLLVRSSDNPVIKMLNTILMDAISQQASDIHFEPDENKVNIRFRIDGILQQRISPPKEFHSQMLTRIKVMAKLDIAEKRLPQDGRIKLRVNKREIDFRVSTIPIVNGERIVLRILDKGNIVLGLDQLGMSERLELDLKKMISMPEGIILVTGPTGSGKTTTLYSALSELNSREVNIMTIEDPVEYKLSEIAQIALNPKIDLTFSRGLRHILRQDPDIIMIGEIRDKETAEIAIQSALTGHLVLSTLHTNDAPSCLTRLADMGIEPYLLSSSIIGVLAQRLVRKLCPVCKEEYSPSKKEMDTFQLNVDSIFKSKGCEACFNTGYKGRHGIYELMHVNLNIKKQILESIDSEEIKKHLDENFIGLRSSASELVRKGITSLEEAMRVTRSYTE